MTMDFNDVIFGNNNLNSEQGIIGKTSKAPLHLICLGSMHSFGRVLALLLVSIGVASSQISP
jgi:hypothetical protein